MLLCAPLAGSPVDRLPRVRVMVAADAARVLLAGSPAIWHGSAPIAYVVAFGLSAGQVFFSPAAQSLLPSVVAGDELVAANSGLWTAAVTAQILIAPAAALLAVNVGFGAALAVNAVSFALSAAVLRGLPEPTRTTSVRPTGPARQTRRSPSAVVGRRVRGSTAERGRPLRGKGRPPVRQPPDRALLRRGRRTRRHARAAPGRPGAGARLGCVRGDPVLRRDDQHRPDGEPATGPAGHHLDLPAGPSPGQPHVRCPTQQAPHRAAGRADAGDRGSGASGQRGPLVPGARPVRRQHGHPPDAGRRDGLPRRERRGSHVLHRGRALPPRRGRGLRHRGRGAR